MKIIIKFYCRSRFIRYRTKK